MSNGIIARNLQAKGVLTANPAALEAWQHYQAESSQAVRRQRHLALEKEKAQHQQDTTVAAAPSEPLVLVKDVEL